MAGKAFRWLLLGLLVTAAAGLAPRVARANIYQCTRPDGSVHFTNLLPRGQHCRVIVRSSRGARGGGPPTGPRSGGARDPSPDRYQRYDAHITEAARLYQLPVPFIRAIMRVESDFSPAVVSHAGAMGLMQLMPRTANAMGVRDPFDPRQNIFGGTRYLRILANRFNGDLVLTIAAYNAGEGAVMRYRGVPPYDETRRYVQNVLRHYYSERARPTTASASPSPSHDHRAQSIANAAQGGDRDGRDRGHTPGIRLAMASVAQTDPAAPPSPRR